MITRQSWTTLVLGALAGAGLGGGALTLVKRSGAGCCARTPCGAPDASASESQPVAESPGQDLRPAGRTFSDGGSAAALALLARSGPADGRWRYQDPRRSADQVLTHDPSDAEILHLRPASDPTAGTKTVPLDVIARVLFGNVRRFLENYRPCDSAARESLDGREFFRVRWCNQRGEPGPVRNVWIDALTHELARFEDRTSDGHLIRRLDFGTMTADQFLPPVPGSAARARDAMPAVSNRTFPVFDDFVAKVEIPIYEPAELPPGYARTEFGFENRSFDPKGAALRVAWIGYDEGVMQMNLFIAPPDDMGRLETLARTASVKGSGHAAPGAPAPSSPASPFAGCASMPEDTPEETIESEGAITVRVRSDGCRIVVRRDDLPGVSIALVGSAATGRDSFIRAIRNLVLVSGGAKPTPRK